MFCRWRATVCSLTTSSAAISRFVFPAATSRSTSQLARGSAHGVGHHGPRATSSRARSGLRAQVLEGRPRRLELEARPHRRRRAPGTPGRRARACARLVRRLELLPRLRTRAAARSSAACASPSRELDRASDACAASASSIGADAAGGDLRRARPRRLARLAELADGERDLRVSGQERRPAASGSVVSAPGHGGSSPAAALDVALRQPKQREAGLRLPPVAARLRGTLPRPRRARPGGGGARPAGTAPRPAAARFIACLAALAGEPRLGESVAPTRPGSCMIPARWARQRPGERDHLRLLRRTSASRALVHSLGPPRARTPPRSRRSRRSRRRPS